IQRLRDGRHFVISGGDLNEPASHAFIARIASGQGVGPWGCNILLSREPSLGDSVVRTLAFDRDLWHAGGLALLGDVLAVPIEGDLRSRIIFIDLGDLEKPVRIPSDIERPDRKAGAVALTRRTDGRFVCAVWCEVQAPRPRGRIDFYLSRDDDLRAGFLGQPLEWRYGDVALPVPRPGESAPEPRDPAYQCINFVTDSSGALYLVGTENGSEKAPIFGGPDRADLFRVELPASFGVVAGPPPLLTRISTRRLFCRDDFGNFDAAAGLYVDPEGRLHLYSAFHWRMDGLIRLTEFSAEPERSGPPVVAPDRAWIELFEHAGFHGRRLTIRGVRNSRLEDYGNILVDGSGFDDKVSAARFRIPAGQTYRLFRDSNFRGGSAGADFFDLVGTGAVVEIDNLSGGRRFGDRVSSSCFVESA
ncbi:MAG: hypothetical protein ACREMQ_11705, partial [Longimicrobiales bacterium]